MSEGETVCDRCRHVGSDVKVRPEMPCCPVPLCEECAVLHRAEIELERYGFYKPKGR